MGTWRRIEIDLDPDESKRKPTEDTLEPSKGAAKAKPKKKVTSKVSIHLCPHAQGELSGWYDCRNDPRAEYEEF